MKNQRDIVNTENRTGMWSSNEEGEVSHAQEDRIQESLRWAVVKGDELQGMIFFHDGDDSKFVAKKKGQISKETKR